MKLVTENGKKVLSEMMDSKKSVGEVLSESDLSPGEKITLMGDLSFIVETIQDHLGFLKEHQACRNVDCSH